jgi:DNA-directed RNA polymerase subunit RPC12/RpoP
MIRFACPSCNQTFTVADDKAGEKFACPSCGQRLLIPRPVPKTTLGRVLPAGEAPSGKTVLAPVPDHAPEPAKKLLLSAGNCPACGAAQFVGPEDAGRWANCPKCGTGFAAIVEMPWPPPPVRAPGLAAPAGVTVLVNNAPDAGAGASGLPTSLGVGSVVLGVLSLFFFVAPPVGVVFAAVGLGLALAGVAASAGRQWNGIGIIIAGGVISLVSLSLNVLMIVIALTYKADVHNTFRPVL